VRTFVLVITPQPGASQQHLIDALQADAATPASPAAAAAAHDTASPMETTGRADAMSATGTGDGGALTPYAADPLLAAADADGELPRNFFVRQVLEGAAASHARVGGACGSGGGAAGVAQQASKPSSRRAGGAGVPRTRTRDSLDGSCSNDGSNDGIGVPSDSSTTQGHSHEGSDRASSPSHSLLGLDGQAASRGRRAHGSVTGSASDDGSGGETSDADVGGMLRGGGDDGGETELRDENGAALDREAILAALLAF
jgi:hypothetical protein